MLVKDTDIYSFIKDNIDDIPILSVKKGDYFCRAHNPDSRIYFILEGEVKVYCTSIMGKKILVDDIFENEFAELCFDINYYNDMVDYEIEYEYKVEHDGYAIFNDILKKVNLKYTSNCKSKIQRALNK